jgi:outer membrane protein OmpA-like peptidoglycan-associated protein
MRSVLTLFITIIFTIEFCSAQNFTLQDTSFTEGEILITYDVRFELGKCGFYQDTVLFLDELAAFLLINPNLVVEIGNHVDERWSKELSRSLSASRAQEIVDYLLQKGISSNKLKAAGYDGTQPIIKNAKTEEEHQVNRRTEIKILKTDFKE